MTFSDRLLASMCTERKELGEISNGPLEGKCAHRPEAVPSGSTLHGALSFSGFPQRP